LRQVDFASFIADWLSDEKRNTDLARFILRLLPEALAASETSGLNSFIGRRILTQIQSIDLAPLATGTLRTFVSEGRHRGFLDELLLAVHETLNKPETMEAIRQKIRSELPTLLKLYRADTYLMKKIAASATSVEGRDGSSWPQRGSDAALDRHHAAHPEDRGANIVLFEFYDDQGTAGESQYCAPSAGLARARNRKSPPAAPSRSPPRRGSRASRPCAGRPTPARSSSARSCPSSLARALTQWPRPSTIAGFRRRAVASEQRARSSTSEPG
jgi:Protein of unknown function (DUF445)